jgi:proton-translocating NADH-quinone oxidoreductase chain L
MFFLALYLLVFLLLFFFGRYFGRIISLWVAIISIGISCLNCVWYMDITIGDGCNIRFDYGSWIDIGNFHVNCVFLLDSLAITLATLISFISLMIIIFSYGYMKSDAHVVKFFAYLSLFAFGMTLLVVAGDFLVMFVGWEIVGLTSYLLINFWDTRTIANGSALKAILYNRIGDVCFLAVIAMYYIMFGTTDIMVIDMLMDTATIDTTTTIGLFGLFIKAYDIISGLLSFAAAAKSAQLFLNNWLPDAMEGPTPVSAVLHSATMVTAGIYLLLKNAAIFLQTAFISQILSAVGIMTFILSCFLSATVWDIKKIIAYSTGSNLGMMFFACANGFHLNALFLLINHAFYKAQLFLCAGSVIHAIHQQDITKAGALHMFLPLTGLTMIIASLSLIGFPFLSGFYAKDFLLSSLFSSNESNFMLIFLVCIGVLLSAFYSFRLITNVFFGPSGLSSMKQHISLHESEFAMLFPIVILTFPSICLGFFLQDFFFQDYTFHFEAISNFHVPTDNEMLHVLFKYLGSICALLGLLFALPFSFMRTFINNIKKKYYLFFDFFENKGLSDLYNNLIIANPFYRILLDVVYKIIEKSNETFSLFKFENFFGLLAIKSLANKLKAINLSSISLLLFSLFLISFISIFLSYNPAWVFAPLPIKPFKNSLNSNVDVHNSNMVSIAEHIEHISSILHTKVDPLFLYQDYSLFCKVEYLRNFMNHNANIHHNNSCIIHAIVDTLDSKVDKLDCNLDTLDYKVDKVDCNLDKLDYKVDKVDCNLDKLDSKVAWEGAATSASIMCIENDVDKIDHRVSKTETKVETLVSEHKALVSEYKTLVSEHKALVSEHKEALNRISALEGLIKESKALKSDKTSQTVLGSTNKASLKKISNEEFQKMLSDILEKPFKPLKRPSSYKKWL